MPPIRLDHIAIALPSLAEAPPVLEAILGGVPSAPRPSGAFRFATWTYANGGRLEVLEPRGADGFLHRFIAARGRGVHHVTLTVPDLDDACRGAEAQGYQIVGRDESDPSWKEAFLHPKQAQGLVVQLAEPAGTGPGPAREPIGAGAAHVLALRLRAHSRARALTQWRDVLRGELHAGSDGALAFRWPDSPMRILVDVDPTAAEGPWLIELTAPRAIPDLEAAGERLGIRLAQRPA